LKPLGKVNLILTKNLGEVLMSTSYEDLHKHGYKPFMRWGVMKETLTAACILESGILDKARKTGKLHVWDPFCGSGSFLIELLMMILERPCRSLDNEMPF
jgi:putative N6-adenine-specific DNA methylase